MMRGHPFSLTFPAVGGWEIYYLGHQGKLLYVPRYHVKPDKLKASVYTFLMCLEMPGNTRLNLISLCITYCFLFSVKLAQYLAINVSAQIERTLQNTLPQTQLWCRQVQQSLTEL